MQKKISSFYVKQLMTVRALVIPMKMGIPKKSDWIPACAGMTDA